MITRRDRVKAGVFVVVSIFLLTGVVILIAGFRIFKTTKTYTVVFTESVTGLENSSVVRYSGVPVGRVSSISFAAGDPRQIEVMIEVDPKTPVRNDTTAQLKPQGITGVYYVDLEGGTPGTPLLPEGSAITARTSVTSELLEMLGDIKNVVTNLNSLIVANRDSIKAAVESIESAASAAKSPIQRLDETLKSAQELIVDLKEGFRVAMADAQAGIRAARSSIEAVEGVVKSPELALVPEKLNAVLDRAVLALDNANALIEETKGTVRTADLKRVVDALEGTLVQLSKTGEDVARTVDQVQAGVRENRGTLLRIAGDFRSFSHTLKVLADEIREDPSRLLFGRRPSTRKEAR